MLDMLNEAQALAGRGFRIIPIHTPLPGGGCSCARPDCGGSAGKHPRLHAWQRDATTDPGKIHMWWRAWPDANIGLVMGGPERLVAVDVDGPGGRATLARIEGNNTPLPPTLTSRSGRVDGGEHRFFRVPEGVDLRAIKNRAGATGGPMPKVDIRAEAGQVVAPPSLHASGNRYAWVDRAAQIAILPEWLYRLATWEAPLPQAPTPSRAEPLIADRARSYLMRIPAAISGSGGHAQTLLAAEHMVRGFGLDDGTAMSLLCEWNRSCSPPWSERELQHKIREARMAGTAVEMGAHLRDDRAAPFRPMAVAPRIALRLPQGDGAALGFLGALLDVPSLFDMPEVLAMLNGIDGALALAVAAAQAEDVAAVVDRTPEPMRDFAARRLAAPEYTTPEEALRWLTHYGRALDRAKRKRAS